MTTTEIEVQMADCPQCGLPTEITERLVLDSTDGPVEHVRIKCVQRHWFLLPVESLERGQP